MRKRNMPSVDIKAVDGFAMIVRGLRNKDEVTDIDYVSEVLSDDFLELSEEIGLKYGFEEHWINNDVLLAGATLEDLEFATGKLSFSDAFNLGNLSVSVLDEDGLLRMKLVTVDTSLMAYESGGEFTRFKDLPDI